MAAKLKKPMVERLNSLPPANIRAPKSATNTTTNIGFTAMGNNIQGAALSPEQVKKYRDTIKACKEKLAVQEYPSTAAIYGKMLEAGLDTEANDLLIKTATCIRDYLDKLDAKLVKKMPKQGGAR